MIPAFKRVFKNKALNCLIIGDVFLFLQIGAYSFYPKIYALIFRYTIVQSPDAWWLGCSWFFIECPVLCPLWMIKWINLVVIKCTPYIPGNIAPVQRYNFLFTVHMKPYVHGLLNVHFEWLDKINASYIPGNNLFLRLDSKSVGSILGISNIIGFAVGLIAGGLLMRWRDWHRK